MGIYKKYHQWCVYHKICPLFREKQFVCTHHGGSEQCGKYKELKQKSKTEKKVISH